MQLLPNEERQSTILSKRPFRHNCQTIRLALHYYRSYETIENALRQYVLDFQRYFCFHLENQSAESTSRV